MSIQIGIATRKSPLAVWQAEHVATSLQQQHSDVQVSLVKLTTKGDKILDQSLSKIGGKDLFVKEIEAALLDGRAQVAVHSLKDVPTDLPEGLTLRAYPPREDPRDALVSLQGYTLDTLPQGALVGTCSLRRAAQLLRLRPDLQIRPIRGNVQTRLEKLRADRLDATILAYAGLLRLQLQHLASQVLPIELSLPAIGQGILAVQTHDREDTVTQLVSRLDDISARTAAVAERAFLAQLKGGCQVPIAGHATVSGADFHLRGLVASLDGCQVFEGEVFGPVGDAARLGQALADRLLSQGADQILASLQAP